MAFMKYARAQVVTPSIPMEGWRREIAAKQNVRTAKVHPNLIQQAEEILQASFSPSNFLLSHVTIVASVDTYAPENVRVGAVVENGQKINRKYADFRVTSESQDFINNNNDAWSRGVIRKAYSTFIGAENYVEHVQVPELSKGKIIDAVARDIGPSLYVDILVATERKHKKLIQEIEDGTMSTLSMGCSIQFSICTHCGHVMVDDTEMCLCCRYQQGNVFFGDDGVKQRIAELCGHESYDDTGGVVFIEGSWVKSPAFLGAVVRNLLEAKEVTPEMVRQAQAVLSQPPDHWIEQGHFVKKANASTSPVSEPSFSGSEVLGFFGGEEKNQNDEGEDSSSKPPQKDRLKEVEDELYEHVVKRVKKRVRNDLEKEDTPSLVPENSTMAPNDTIIKEGTRESKLRNYMAGVHSLTKTAKSFAEFANNLSVYNESLGISIPRGLYVASVQLGPKRRYASLEEFRIAAQEALGKPPSDSEIKVLIRLATWMSNTKGE